MGKQLERHCIVGRSPKWMAFASPLVTRWSLGDSEPGSCDFSEPRRLLDAFEAESSRVERAAIGDLEKEATRSRAPGRRGACRSLWIGRAPLPDLVLTTIGVQQAQLLDPLTV
jgi:hypothetical protein